MIALRFRINNEDVVIAGPEYLGFLTASVSAVGKLGPAAQMPTKRINQITFIVILEG